MKKQTKKVSKDKAVIREIETVDPAFAEKLLEAASAEPTDIKSADETIAWLDQEFSQNKNS